MPALPGLRRYLVVLTALGMFSALFVLVQAEGLATLLTGGGISLFLVVALLGRAALTWGHGVLSGRFAATVRAGQRRRQQESAYDRAGVVATQITRGVEATDSNLTG